MIMMGTLKKFVQTVMIMNQRDFMMKHLDNQIPSWSRDRNIGYLSINCFYWSTLNSIYENSIIYEIFGFKIPISFSKCN